MGYVGRLLQCLPPFTLIAQFAQIQCAYEAPHSLQITLGPMPLSTLCLMNSLRINFYAGWPRQILTEDNVAEGREENLSKQEEEGWHICGFCFQS